MRAQLGDRGRRCGTVTAMVRGWSVSVLLAAWSLVWATWCPLAGFDKVAHMAAAVLVMSLAGLVLRPSAALGVTVAVGVGLEVVQGTDALGAATYLVGGDAEVADVVADLWGAAVAFTAFPSRLVVPPRWSRAYRRRELTSASELSAVPAR